MYLNNDVQQWWYFLVTTIAICSTIGTFCLDRVWSLDVDHCRVGNRRMWWWIWSLSVVSTTLENCLTTFRRWNNASKEDQWSSSYLRSTVIALLITGECLKAIWRSYGLNEDNQELWSAPSFEIFLKKRKGGFSFWLLTILAVKVLNCIGGTVEFFPCILHKLLLVLPTAEEHAEANR